MGFSECEASIVKDAFISYDFTLFKLSRFLHTARTGMMICLEGLQVAIVLRLEHRGYL